MKRIDLTGKQFHRLTVLGYSHSHIQPSGQKRAIWDVVCNCGNKLKVSTANHISNNTKSCGCYIDELRRQGMVKRTPDSEIKAFMVTYQHSAKSRNKGARNFHQFSNKHFHRQCLFENRWKFLAPFFCSS